MTKSCCIAYLTFVSTHAMLWKILQFIVRNCQVLGSVENCISENYFLLDQGKDKQIFYKEVMLQNKIGENES